MKFLILAIAGGLAGVTAQLSGVPKCAQPCVLQYTTGSNIAGCASTDIACICSNKNFLSGIACCMVPVCDAADQAAATTYAHQICLTQGITNLPDAVSCASSSTTQSSTSLAPSSTASTGTSGTTSGSSSASTTPAHSTSASSAASSSAAAATKNVGLHNVAGVGAGVAGGLAAVIGALL